MNLKWKIWLILGLVMLGLVGLAVFLDYREVESMAQVQMRQQAQDLRAALMATRRVYHRQFLSSGLPLNEDTLGFLPAHALSRIAQDYPNWSISGVRFNNVSDRPRNPANQADADELAAMAWFRAHPQAGEYTGALRDKTGRRFFHFATPIWTEAYCLQCHATPEAAPAAIRERYSAGYGYQVGELRGVLSIRIPMESGLAAAEAHSRRELKEQGLVLLMVLATLGILLNYFVTRRVAALRGASHRLAKGDFATRVAVSGTDEIAGLADDINSMAATLGHRERSLQDSEARYLALFEHMQTGFALHQIITDAHGQAVDYRFTLANPAFLSLMGMSEESLIGRRVSEIYPQIRDDPTDWIGIYGKVASEGEPVRFKSYFALLDRWVSVVAYRPEPGHFAVLIDDITESRRAEELEHYSAFQAGIAEMSTSVLHNIGNAITAVTQDAEVIDQTGEALLRVAELLDNNAVASEQLSTSDSMPTQCPRQFAIQKEAARAIRRLSDEELSQRSRRLQVSVRHIADIIRIQQSAALPDNQTSSFSLAQAIQSALDMQGDAFDKRGIQVTLAVDPAVDLVTLSHNRILQTLVNAVRNSIEAIEIRAAAAASEGVAYQGRMHIHAEAVDQTRLRITVEDNGVGFDPATAASLFRFGFSTKARGSGFGLHSVAVFAQEFGGSARLESDGIGQGARLIVELPRASGAKGGQQ